MTSAVRLVLASASPARARLLRSAGIDPEVLPSEVDEDALAPWYGSPVDLALGLAQAKAGDVADRLADALVLGCDSVLEVPDVPELAGLALGKPSSAADAVRRWQLMGGRQGLLHTGHCLVDLRGGDRRDFSAVASTAVQFERLPDAEIEAYVATGEPLAVAGAFTIDGLGGAFVRGVTGDPSNVVGLSLPLLRELLSRAGVFYPTLWTLP